jgi:hypothetical protein
MTKHIHFISILLFGSFLQLNAQETGAFQNTLEVTEPGYTVSRNLYYYVPTDYNSDNSYKLIVGFRGGPHSNAGQFRDQLSPLADSLDAIIICPENSADFNNNEGNVKHLFNYAVDTAVSLYNIDTNFVYITGLSYGGRHTIIVSMDTDAGDIPMNIRGIIPFAPGMNSQNVADYENSTLFPICTCIGSLDNTFMSVATSFHNSVVDNDGIALLNEIEGVGHTTAFPTFVEEMMTCFSFIETAYIASSIKELSDKEVKVFPNPATHEITLELSEVGNYFITVIGVDGKTVFSDYYSSIKSLNINVEEYTAGTYLLKIENDLKEIAIKRFLVQ